MKEAIMKLSFLLILIITLFSCSPTDKYPRKKLPDMPESDDLNIGPTNSIGKSSLKKLSEPVNEWWDLCSGNHNNDEQGSYNIAETTIAGRSYYSVQIINGTNDTALLDIVKLYRPLAGSVVSMLLNGGRVGALIDFSMPGNNSIERAEFLVKNAKGQSFSVIFMWDRLSAGQAFTFMNELEQLPGIESTRIGDNKNF